MLLKSTTTAIATLSVTEPKLNVFEIAVNGFLFVSFVLILLSCMTWILGKLFTRLAAGESSSPADNVSGMSPAGRSQASTVGCAVENDPHYIAVIAAAIHCATDGREHRIVAIRWNDSANS